MIPIKTWGYQANTQNMGKRTLNTINSCKLLEKMTKLYVLERFNLIISILLLQIGSLIILNLNESHIL